MLRDLIISHRNIVCTWGQRIRVKHRQAASLQKLDTYISLPFAWRAY